MEYCLPIGSGRSLIPLSLVMRSGERIGTLVPGVDSASAMVAVESADGNWNQEFHPLRILTDSLPEIGASEWALRGLRYGSKGWSYFLDLPKIVSQKVNTKSLSIQIVGHASFHPNGFFEGQLGLTLGKSATPSRLSRFSSLRDQWLPELLPRKFTGTASLQAIPGESDRKLLLVPLKRLEGVGLPPSLRPDWEASGWTDAVAENAAGNLPAHFLIRGGCFWTAEDGASHWFGGKIGLDKPGFRAKAAEHLRTVAASMDSGWCFWVETSQTSGQVGGQKELSIRIRHPVMALAYKEAGEMLRNGGTASSLPYRHAMEMLRDAACLQVQGRSESETELESFYRKHSPILRDLADFVPTLNRDRVMNPLADIVAFAAAVYKTQETK